MEQLDWRSLGDKLAGFYPTYVPDLGDATTIITTDGETIIAQKSIRAVLQSLARSFALDLCRTRQIYGNLLGQRNCVPLPVTTKIVLVPLKVRKPRSRQDGTFGYINFHQYLNVTEYAAGDYRSKVILRNGFELPCIFHLATVRKQIRNTIFVYNEYLHRQGADPAAGEEGKLSRAEMMQLVQGILALCRNIVGE